jgi:hypothetical protein
MSVWLCRFSCSTGSADCPFNALRVIVTKCSGEGDCAPNYAARVFTTSPKGLCVVTNGVLCFGCMAYVARCTENGVTIIPNEADEYCTLKELLR